MYGIIGFPLMHSWSPGYFNEKLQKLSVPERYASFPLERIEAFPGLLRQHPGLRGLNVTHPFKQSVIPYLNGLSEIAAEVGAVNCIKIDADGQMTGYNTDVTGFQSSLEPLLQPQDLRALVLGGGGAAKAVTYVLTKLGIKWHIVSRSGREGALSYADLSDGLVRAHSLIINATPVGMFPNQDQAPDIPYSALSAAHLLYDLVYNPRQTLFLTRGLQQGARIKDGYEMLLLQAAASWEIWQSS